MREICSEKIDGGERLEQVGVVRHPGDLVKAEERCYGQREETRIQGGGPAREYSGRREQGSGRGDQERDIGEERLECASGGGRQDAGKGDGETCAGAGHDPEGPQYPVRPHAGEKGSFNGENDCEGDQQPGQGRENPPEYDGRFIPLPCMDGQNRGACRQQAEKSRILPEEESDPRPGACRGECPIFPAVPDIRESRQQSHGREELEKCLVPVPRNQQDKQGGDEGVAARHQEGTRGKDRRDRQ